MISKADKRVQDVEKSKSEADGVWIGLKDISGLLQETILELNNYGSNDNHVKLPVALQEANRYLDDIKLKSKDVEHGKSVLECANRNLNHWDHESNVTMKQQIDLINLKYNIGNLTYRLDDMKSLTHKSFRDAMETEVLLTHNQKNFEKLQKKIEEVETLHEDINLQLNTDIIAQTDTLMEMVHDDIGKLKVDNDDLQILNVDLNTTIYECADGLKEAHEVWLPQSRKHASGLANRAKVSVLI